jgi:two-component system cell cycle sensor histidine kinase/response regulator CckA
MGPASQRVLIVDDEPALLKMMSVFLGRQGYVVADAATTEAAWSKIEAAPGEFDVVVLDGTMSGIGVEELALQILAANARLRVLAASGYPMDMTSLEAAAPGRVAFLQKPFGPASLVAAVRRLLGAEEEDL